MKAHAVLFGTPAAARLPGPLAAPAGGVHGAITAVRGPAWRVAAASGVVAAALSLGGCALVPVPPAPGQSAAEVQAAFGTPTARYALPEGGQRLEHATGPFGRTTWMVDLDASGRVTRSQQVLTDTNLMLVQRTLPGMTRDELLRTLGSPGRRRAGGWQGGEVWSWRFATNECLWFQVSLGDDGLVRDGSFGPDPVCESPGNQRS